MHLQETAQFFQQKICTLVKAAVEAVVTGGSKTEELLAVEESAVVSV